MNKKIDEVIARVEREAEETGRIIRESSIFERTVQKEKTHEKDTANVNVKDSEKDTEQQGQDPTPSLVVKLPVSSPTDSANGNEDLPRSLVVKLPILSPTDTIKVSEKQS